MARQMCLACVQGWKMKNYGSEGPWALERAEVRGRGSWGEFSSAEKSSSALQGWRKRGREKPKQPRAMYVGLLLKGQCSCRRAPAPSWAS